MQLDVTITATMLAGGEGKPLNSYEARANAEKSTNRTKLLT